MDGMTEHHMCQRSPSWLSEAHTTQDILEAIGATHPTNEEPGITSPIVEEERRRKAILSPGNAEFMDLALSLVCQPDNTSSTAASLPHADMTFRRRSKSGVSSVSDLPGPGHVQTAAVTSSQPARGPWR